MEKMEKFEDYGIIIPETSRNIESLKMVCPKCPPHSKDTDKSKDLYVHLKDKKWKCFRCGFAGMLKEKRIEKIRKDYKKPEWKNKTELSANLVKWFESRLISQATLVKMKITESVEFMPEIDKKANCINFNYFREDELVNIKFRDGNKHFKLFSGAELILYNLDSIKNYNWCIVTEGEIDCLTYIEAGFIPVVSVPNGANKATNNLQYIDNCWDYFENKEKIYIATDDDLNGRKLRDDLIQRFGADRCFIVTYDGEKDVNDLKKKWISNDYVSKTIENAKEVKINGIFTLSDTEDELDDVYINGLSKGLTIGLENLDELLSYIFGTLMIVTGIPTHGKSEVVDDIVVRLCLLNNFKAAYFSPENFPIKIHMAKLISRITGCEFNSNYLSKEEYLMAKSYLNDNFFFIYPQIDKKESFDIDTILEKAEFIIKKNGVRILVIDPYNKIEFQLKNGESETLYISRLLEKLSNFAQRTGVLLILIAHPTKMKKNNGIFDIPTLYDIAGSANFYNKAFYGLSVYRIFDDFNPLTQIEVQKVKFRHLGKVGTAFFKFNHTNGRFIPQVEGKLILADNNNYLTNGINLKSVTQDSFDYNQPVQSEMPF